MDEPQCTLPINWMSGISRLLVSAYVSFCWFHWMIPGEGVHATNQILNSFRDQSSLQKPVEVYLHSEGKQFYWVPFVTNQLLLYEHCSQLGCQLNWFGQGSIVASLIFFKLSCPIFNCDDLRIYLLIQWVILHSIWIPEEIFVDILIQNLPFLHSLEW